MLLPDPRSYMLTLTTDSLAGAGGAADGPEPLEDAIVRETREEYGLDVKIVPVQDRKVLAETEDCLSDGSVWSCHWYLLQLSDTKQVPRVCQSCPPLRERLR